MCGDAAVTAASWMHVDDETASDSCQQAGASHVTVWTSPPAVTVSGTVQHSTVDQFQTSIDVKTFLRFVIIVTFYVYKRICFIFERFIMETLAQM